MLRIYDKNGAEKDWNWVRQEFGSIAIAEAPPGPAWRVTELREADGYAAILVRGREGLQIARWWPDPDLPNLPTELSTWKSQGVTATVKPEGHCDFGMGGGDYYYPPAGGASWYWAEGESDCCQGWGMIGSTNHRHLDITFEWIEEPAGNEPPVAEFSWMNDGLTVGFDGSFSYDPDGEIVSHYWTFGDGSSNHGVVVYHTYDLPGVYPVELLVTDDDGAEGYTDALITVMEQPSTIEEAKRLIREAQVALGEAQTKLDEALAILEVCQCQEVV